MLFVVDGRQSTETAFPAALATEGGRVPIAAASACIEIGLLNNMGDAALQATERQFVDLIAAAAGPLTVRLRFSTLPEIPRGEAATAHVRATYTDIKTFTRAPLDALIVTGKEPRSQSLSDEPYWGSFAAIVDWAEHNTVSSIWSCLASHAAVLHLDGVERRPFAAKRSGIFRCARVADDPLLDGIAEPLPMPHSRWNDLREDDLSANGYRALTRSEAGVDIFAKQWRSLFVFIQGHPEYDGDSLLREYRRDIGRYLRGESPSYPEMPTGYFDREAELRLRDFARRARGSRDRELLADFPADLTPRNVWREQAVKLLGNWLAYLAARKA